MASICRPRALIGALLGVALLVTVSGGRDAALAKDPVFVDWTSLLPSLTDAFDPNSANDCVAGRPHCVDATIKEMDRRLPGPGPKREHRPKVAPPDPPNTQTLQRGPRPAGQK